MRAKWGDIGVELRLNLGMGTQPQGCGHCSRGRRTAFEAVESAGSARLGVIAGRAMGRMVDEHSAAAMAAHRAATSSGITKFGITSAGSAFNISVGMLAGKTDPARCGRAGRRDVAAPTPEPEQQQIMPPNRKNRRRRFLRAPN